MRSNTTKLELCIVESGQEQTDLIIGLLNKSRLLSGERQGRLLPLRILYQHGRMDIDLQPGDRVIVYSILQDNVIQESYIAERVRAPILNIWCFCLSLC